MYNGCNNCSGCGYSGSDSYHADSSMPNEVYNAAVMDYNSKTADDMSIGMMYNPAPADDFKADKEEYKSLDEEQMQRPEEQKPEEERINFDNVVDELMEEMRMKAEQKKEEVVVEESDSE